MFKLFSTVLHWLLRKNNLNRVLNSGLCDKRISLVHASFIHYALLQIRICGSFHLVIHYATDAILGEHHVRRSLTSYTMLTSLHQLCE